MGPEDQHPWDREDEEIRQVLAQKDSEIARLKEEKTAWLGPSGALDSYINQKDSEIARLKEQSRSMVALYESILDKKNALITELAAALRNPSPKGWQGSADPNSDLLERAEEGK